MSYIRYFNFVIALFSALVTATPFAIIRPFNPANNKVIMRIIRFYSLILCGIRLHIENQDILEKNHPSIVIANHQHNIDATIASCFFTKHMVVLGKFELGLIPYFGQIYILFGNLLIKRGNRKKSMQSMQELEKRIVDKKLSVLVFPEGTRNQKQEELLPFKKGAFITAIKTQAPLIPISISQYNVKGQLSKFGMMDVYLKVHEPIPTKGLDKKAIPELMEQSRSVLTSGIAELNKKYQ